MYPLQKSNSINNPSSSFVTENKAPAGNNSISHDTTCNFSYSLLAVNRSHLALTNVLCTSEPASIQTNQQIEKKLAGFAADSFAAHYTIDAMLGTFLNLCEIVESYLASGTSKPTLIGQLHVRAKLINAYTKEENLPFSYVGQMDGGALVKLLNDIKKGLATSNLSSEPWALREKANAYEVLICSAYFRDVISKIKHDPYLRHHVSHLVDSEWLDTLAHSDKPQQPRQVVLFPPKWQGEFTQDDSREKRKKAGPDYTTTAAHLLETNRLTQREQRLALHDPRNRPKQGTILHENYVMPLKEVIMKRGKGCHKFVIKETSTFAIKALKHHLPTVAGPSGTTKRFFDASLLLSPGIKSQLYINTKKTEPHVQQQPTDTEFKELLRWVTTAYLVDDQHHSMIEVSLGAAEHGLPPQWNPENLYQHPFSKVDKRHG